MDGKCCIPYCCKVEEDSSVTLHDFPENPDVAAKWIENINLFLKNGGTWFPQSNSVICSSHFLPGDFNPASKTRSLKRRSVPTVFVWRDIKIKKVQKKPEPKAPMIVKVHNPVENDKTQSPSPVDFKSDSIEASVSSDVSHPFKVTQVFSLAGSNLPTANNHPTEFFLPNIVTLPANNIDSGLCQKNHINIVADGQCSLPSVSLPINIPQFTSGTPFNSNQLILLPQALPPSSVQNTNFIIFPDGKALPPPGKKIMLLQTNGPLLANKNIILQEQPNVMTSASSNLPGRSLLINQIKDTSALKCDSLKNSLETAIVSTSSVVNFDDHITPTTAEITKGDTLISQSNISQKEPEMKINQDLQKSYSLGSKVGAQKRSNECDKSIEAAACVKKKKARYTKDKTSDLIEIGPSTFMKINPDIIKVTKKETPNGNTVLQFVMNPNLVGQDLKKPLFSFTNNRADIDKSTMQTNEETFLEDLDDPEALVPDSTSQNEDTAKSNNAKNSPVLLTTTLPIQHTLSSMRIKCAKALKLKSTQICRLNGKIKALEKKIEELENKCIVQERQLNFASLKKLKTIKHDAERGVPHAAFILEQIRGYFGKNVRVNWSHSTLVQCSIWCRKAPYAYEYFKKDDLFRLPAINTIKRFMQRNPEVRSQIKNKVFRKVRNPDESSSSSDFDSDFDFDESDDENLLPSEDTNEVIIPVETILSCPQSLGEDSQSSSGVHFEPHIETPTTSKSRDNSVPTPSNSQLSDEEDIDSSPTDKDASSELESKGPLTNIFGKILCEMGGSTNKDMDQADNSDPNELHDETLIVTSSTRSLVTKSSNQGHTNTSDGSDSQGSMSVDGGSNSQELITMDECSNNEELMSADDISNNREVIATNSRSGNQTVMITNDDGDSLLIGTEDSNIEETVVANDNSNNYYLQTSEQDGVTTINVDGQEIIIPPGTILQLNSDLVSSDELGNHFIIIPSADYRINEEDNQCTTNPSLDETVTSKEEVESSISADVIEGDVTDTAAGT